MYNPVTMFKFIRICLEIVKFIKETDDSSIINLELEDITFDISKDKIYIFLGISDDIEIGAPLLIMSIFGLGKPLAVDYDFDVTDLLNDYELEKFNSIMT
jgi:hypothetical protein